MQSNLLLRMYDNINYYEIYCFFLSQIDCPFSTCTEAALSKFRPLTLNAYQSAKIREYDNCFSLCRKNTIFYISIVQSYATIFQCLVHSIIVGFFLPGKAPPDPCLSVYRLIISEIECV